MQEHKGAVFSDFGQTEREEAAVCDDSKIMGELGPEEHKEIEVLEATAQNFGRASCLDAIDEGPLVQIEEPVFEGTTVMEIKKESAPLVVNDSNMEAELN